MTALRTVILLLLAAIARAEPPTRAEAVAIARAFAEHRWEATEKHILHGPDQAKIEVHTPNLRPGEDAPGLWKPGAANTGIPYKWGGFDSLASFNAGLRAGRAAGDLYSSEKRRLADAAVSAHAVGLDCSGFISRCWRLERKHGTATLPSLCQPLRSAADLRPGDILNAAGGHVVLFAQWLDDTKTRARFYEAEPYSKVLASEKDAIALAAGGFKPWRYRRIRD